MNLVTDDRPRAIRREKSERQEREARNVLVSWWTNFLLSMVFLLWLGVGI